MRGIGEEDSLSWADLSARVGSEQRSTQNKRLVTVQVLSKYQGFPVTSGFLGLGEVAVEDLVQFVVELNGIELYSRAW